MSYFMGLSLGLSLIISLGMQNIFVINQGIKRQYHYLVALICSICDSLLVLLSFTSAGLLVQRLPLLQAVLWILAILFLLYFAIGNLCQWFKSDRKDSVINSSSDYTNLYRLIIAALAFSLLNPQAIIEMFVLIGGLASNYHHWERIYFVSGVMSASFIWFFGISLVSSRAASFLQRAEVWRYVDLISSILLLGLAVYFSINLKALLLEVY